MLFQLLLFFKNLLKVPTREFIVFNCCSCTRSKIGHKWTHFFALFFHAWKCCFKYFLLLVAFLFFFALFLFIFLWVLFNFLLLRLQRFPLHCLLPQRHQYQSWSLLEQRGESLALLVQGDSHVLDWLAEWFSRVAGSRLINYRNGGCL